MEGAWDPATGQTIRSNELAALLTAAGAAPQNRAQTDRAHDTLAGDALAVKLQFTPDGTLLDEFFTQDKQEATSRICSFLERLTDQSTRVVVECGPMSAVVGLHLNGHCYYACFVHRGILQAAPAPRSIADTPTHVVYSPCQIAEWSLRVVTAFLGVAANERLCRSIVALGERRRIANGGIDQEVPPTPVTPWLAPEGAEPMGVW